MSKPVLRERLQAVLAKVERSHELLRSTLPAPDMPLQVENLLEEVLADIRSMLGIRMWPEPTTDEPDLETLEEWMFDGCCEATDGCIVEPDGRCPHGHPSWLLRLGLI